MTVLWIDFETRSRCDLKTKGVYNYAQDYTTDVLCMSYAFDDGDVVTWQPGQPFPAQVAQHTGQIRAHNAAFERLIFWYVLHINFKLGQFYCTAAQARANCAPGSLEDVGRFASADMRKDYRGAQLIRLLSIPQADGTFRESATLMDEMIRYCEQDVRAMRAVSKAMRDLSAEELADYHVNERINDRGVRVDRRLCDAAIKYAEAEKLDIEALVVEITQGDVPSVRSPRMRNWVLERVGAEAIKLMTTYVDGEKRYSIDKNVRANLLSLAEENPDEVPAHVADVIQCADDLWASSVAKFNRLAALADEEDHRVRGAFVFAGGSATGRASSYGAQVHNFTRKTVKAPDEVRQAMVRGHEIVPKYGKRVTDVLKGMLRPALIPADGHVFVVADWSAIEGRVHPWLSDCKAGEEKLDVFRSGRDPYCVNAAATFRVPYEDVVAAHEAGNSDMRQIGKVQELALGFLRVAFQGLDVFLFDTGSFQGLRKCRHCLANHTIKECLGIVQCDHVLVGLDQSLSSIGPRYGVGYRQHFVDRFRGVVDETDVGRGLRRAGCDVVRHAAQSLGHHARVGFRRHRGARRMEAFRRFVAGVDLDVDIADGCRFTTSEQQVAQSDDAGLQVARHGAAAVVRRRVEDHGADQAHDQLFLLLADRAADLIEREPHHVALDEGGIADVGVARIGCVLHHRRGVGRAGEARIGPVGDAAQILGDVGAAALHRVVEFADDTVDQRLRGLAGIDVHRVDLVDLVEGGKGEIAVAQRGGGG